MAFHVFDLGLKRVLVGSCSARYNILRLSLQLQLDASPPVSREIIDRFTSAMSVLSDTLIDNQLASS